MINKISKILSIFMIITISLKINSAELIQCPPSDSKIQSEKTDNEKQDILDLKFFAAVCDGNIKLADEFLKQGANINRPPKEINNASKIIESIISYKLKRARCELYSKFDTPIEAAIDELESKMVKFLLEKGVDRQSAANYLNEKKIDILNEYNPDKLYSLGHILKLLQIYDIPLSILDRFYQLRSLYHKTEQQNEAFLFLLLNGADPTRLNNINASSPNVIEIYKQYQKELLSLIPKLKYKSHILMSLIHQYLNPEYESYEANNYERFAFAEAKFKDPNAKPLRNTKFFHDTIIEVLKYGADPNFKDEKGKSFLDYAKENNDLKNWYKEFQQYRRDEIQNTLQYVPKDLVNIINDYAG